jgi:hypothetical protein
MPCQRDHASHQNYGQRDRGIEPVDAFAAIDAVVAVGVYDDRGRSTRQCHGVGEQPTPFMMRGRLRGLEGFG